MADKSRVSKKIADFNSYIRNTDDYNAVVTPGGTANYQRLGMSDAEFNQWHGFRTQWDTLYSKYSDKKESRTTAIKDKLRALMKDFEVFARNILNEIAGIRTSTIDDLRVYHIKAKDLRDTEPSPIHSTDPPVVALKGLGGGIMDVHFRKTADQTRPSMLPNYVGELRYVIDAVLPDDPDAIPSKTTVVSSKAHFKLNLGLPNIGKRLHAYARWTHKHDSQFSSGWALVMDAVIN